MVLNTKRVLEYMEKGGLDREAVSTKTGLTLKSLDWIFENGDISVDALERIADALDVGTNEIAGADPTMENENVIEFVRDGSSATVTFCQGRYISKIRKLAAKYPEECRIVAENKSIVALVPVGWIKVNPPKKVSEEQRAAASERMRGYHLESVLCTDETA